MHETVLIVDDDETKIGLLSKELIYLGISENDIFCSKNAADARKLLSNRKFRVLLLDLNLPLRKDSVSAPSAEVGIELLRQIVEDSAFPSPEIILGVTADIASMNSYAEDFRRLTSQILLVEPGSSDWKYSLRMLVGRIKNSNNTSYDVDICILSTLRVPEQSELLKLDFSWLPEESLGTGILFRRGSIQINGCNRRVISAHASQMGLVSATLLTRILLETFRPRLMLMNGICGGIGDKPKLGDLVIAEKSWDWQSGKWLNDGNFEIAPDSRDASPHLAALAIGLSSKMQDYHNAFPGTRPPSCSRVFNGPMVSGSSVVADSRMHSKFVIQHRKSIAVDMECYGMYYACEMSPVPRSEFLCIKGISDLADRSKSDDLQEYCSYMSARLIMDVAGAHLMKLS